MKILITGATGLVGQEVVKLCHESEIKVNYLTTSKEKIWTLDNYKGYYWNPKKQEIDPECFDGVEIIIHLAGATVSKRWTKSYRKSILESRTTTSSFLLSCLKKYKNHIRHIVSASAIGIYPSSFQNYYEETHREFSNDFLGTVVQKWENEINLFKNEGIKVSLLRIGLVLSNEGGAFPKIITPIKIGLGACFGQGKQWQSWIHVEDLARLFMFVVHDELEGIYNAVAPNPVSNKAMVLEIAKQINKTIWLPGVPKFVLAIVLGKMHTLLFMSQRVSCDKIMKRQFEFRYKNIHQAVTQLVAK